jgi:hypothetical protein
MVAHRPAIAVIGGPFSANRTHLVVTGSVIAHGPDNDMNLLGCVGVSAVKQ